jgi:hypothetical protein
MINTNIFSPPRIAGTPVGNGSVTNGIAGKPLGLTYKINCWMGLDGEGWGGVCDEDVGVVDEHPTANKPTNTAKYKITTIALMRMTPHYI